MMIRLPRRAKSGSGVPWVKQLGAKRFLPSSDTATRRCFLLQEGQIYEIHCPLEDGYIVPVALDEDEWCVSPRSGIRYVRFWCMVQGGKLLRVAAPVKPRRSVKDDDAKYEGKW